MRISGFSFATYADLGVASISGLKKTDGVYTEDLADKTSMAFRQMEKEFCEMVGKEKK